LQGLRELRCLACVRANVASLEAQVRLRSDCQKAAAPLCRHPAMSRHSVRSHKAVIEAQYLIQNPYSQLELL
jgi:hypothetical protein